MEQLEYSIENKKGKHINYEDRIKIEALAKAGHKSEEIGKQIGRSGRTIRRELNRGKVRLLNSDLTERYEYSADVGQKIHDENAAAKGPVLKIGKDYKLVAYIEQAIGKDGKSPYAAIEAIKNEGLDFEESICYKTVYNYIDNDLFLNISNKDLPVKKNSKKRNYKKIRTAITNPKGTSISERPEYIEERKEYGHWELDTVVGKKGTKNVLMVLTERSTREEMIFKIKSKSQYCIVTELNKSEEKLKDSFYDTFKTITCDNGCENLDYEGMENSILLTNKKRTNVYYAHPYSSFERGSNENANKLIRRFIPKGADISSYSDEEIKYIENWINNYPRRIFNGASSYMMKKRMVA